MEQEQHQAPATPEEIRNILREITESQRELSESQQEFSEGMKELKERMKDTDRQLKETKKQTKEDMKELKERMKETDRQIKDTDRQIKETGRQLKKTDARFNSQWGKLMESLVEGDLVPLLRGQGRTVNSTLTRVNGRRNGEHYEYDILAVDDGEVVVVEVKTTLRAEDVPEFLGKLGRFTGYRSEYRGWQVYGAVAYLKADQTVVVHAERQGLYVIRATGSSARIVNGAGFQPRVFA